MTRRKKIPEAELDALCLAALEAALAEYLS